MTSDPDGALLDQYVRTQDPVAFDQIARRYRAMVFATARRVTRSHHDAEDVAQNCFLELAKKASSVRTSIAAFLHSTATRRAIDLLRDQNRRKKHEQRAAVDRAEPVADVNSLERAWDEISPEVDQAIDRLPADLKTFVILYFLRGLSVPDIVVETGLKKGMVERRLQVGVRRLRAELAKGDRIVSAGVLAAGFKASHSMMVPASLTAATGRMAFAAGPTPRHTGGAPSSSNWHLRWPRWVAPVGAGLLALSMITLGTLHWLAKPAVSPTTPYDEINRMYSSYLPASENSRVPLHTSQIKSDGYSFWRGAQPLFYQWCKTNCHDWLADSDACVLSDASPNLEDLWRTNRYSNTDDSAKLPVQIELLQGMITVRIASDRAFGQLKDCSSLELARVICQSYSASLLTDRTVVPPRDNEIECLGTDRYVDGQGTLQSVISNRQGNLVAFLRPSPLDAATAERLLADAVSRNSQLRNICGSTRPRIRDIRACVRRDSMVTDGQLVLLIQLQGTGVLLEMKRQVPAPAELADAIPRDHRSAAQRAAEDAAVIAGSNAAAVGWCDYQAESFTIAPLALYPQICNLSDAHTRDPIEAGRAWAAATAVSHRNAVNRLQLLQRITPQFQTELASRCDAYLRVMHTDLEQFNSDWRVARDRSKQNELSLAWTEQLKAEKK